MKAAFVFLLLTLAAPGLQTGGAEAPKTDRARPNIIFILADDLGYGELGCYGQKIIQTPNLDRMAAEGLRFTRFYAGSTVCAPSRSVLMTGQHMGHTRVRGNASGTQRTAQMLRDEDFTVAELLKKGGYRTGLIGKWGLGMPGDEGHPNKQGFDYFFGYLSQVHAHNHFPSYLWRNNEKVPLPNDLAPMGQDGAGYSTNRAAYAGDEFAREALEFVEKHRSEPFFLYLSLVVPHANNERNRALGNGAEVPDFGPYQHEPWTEQLKGHAAMITRMDGDIGRLLARLRELGLAENTLVMFTSDNGPHKESGQNPDFFDPNGPLRGFKRDLFDGGIRVPAITWKPGTIKPGTTDHVAYFGDVMATFAEITGQKAPEGLDSISFLPTLAGNQAAQRTHEHLYWEFHEGGFTQGALIGGRWKGIRLKRLDAPIQVYDLSSDPGEEKNLASEQPARVERFKKLFAEGRKDSAEWPVKEAPAARK
jgi:arylsulfatase A-like enzyme